MAGVVGELSMWLAFSLALLMSVLPLLTRNSALLVRLGQSQSLLVCLAFFCLMTAFLQNDFRIDYVAEHGNIHLPLYYKLSATWSGHEGSLLLWLMILSAVLTLSISQYHAQTICADIGASIDKNTSAISVAISGVILSATLGFAIFTSNPFTSQLFNESGFVPINGRDLNPLLQDPALTVHPPLLFLGYVSFAPTFVLMCAALLKKHYPNALFTSMQQWARFGWVALTLGIALGSFWAYYELGWGGFWFWDPVENASLLPWFFATALLHALSNHKTMRSWLAMFAISTFLLSILATFLVRSGVLISVHSFATDNTRGIYLLAMLLLFSVPSLSLLLWRSDTLKTTMETTRKTTTRLTPKNQLFLNVNNLLLLVAGFTVLLGTLAPIVFNVLFAQPISVGAPYFNLMMTPLWALALMFLIVMSWHKRALIWVGAVLVAMVSVYALQTNWSHANLLAWALLTLLAIAAVTTVSKKQPVHILIAHLGFFIMSAGIIVTSYFSTTQTMTIKQGEQITFAGYDIQLLQQTQSDNAVYRCHQVHFLLSKKSKSKVLTPEKRRYNVGGQVLSETAIWATLTHDVLISLGNISEDTSSWRVRLQYRPLVRWIWLGALVMAGAVLLTLLRRRT